MSSLRVALIFDETARPETTGVYCRRALAELCEVVHFRPAELERVPRTGFDLYLNIDDGLRYVLPAELHPSAFWAIDTHMDFDWCLTKAHEFDFVFAAQRDGRFRLCDEGISTTWLPLACDPVVHGKHDVAKTFDVCFVGNVFPGERSDLLHLLTRQFRNNYVGRCYFEEMARTYSSSRVVFNRSVRNDVNMRVFEAVASGSLLMTNDLRDNGQDELFRDGQHLATYRDGEELLDKVRYYLGRDDVRERIAAAGRAEALAKHTYRHRMEVILATAERIAIVAGVNIPAAVGVAGAGDFASPGAGVAGGNTPRADAHSGASRTQPRPPACRAAPDTRQIASDPSYFEFARPELLALVPGSARRVLDIGCGAGRLGEAIKARQLAEVVGIERNETAARVARGRLNEVLCGDIESMALPFASGAFDAIVCGDVLEHLHFPERLLLQARDWLRPDGQLIASIPNVRHHTVLRSLMEGNWTYEPAGLLDRTHLRFFTRRDIEDLFHAAGFAIAEWRAVPGAGDEEWWREGARDAVHAGRLHVTGLPVADAQEFYVYQYLVTARALSPHPPAPSPKEGEGETRRPHPPAPSPKEGEGEKGLRAHAPNEERNLCLPSPSLGEGPGVRGEGPRARALRIMLLGDFGSSWRHEALTANALLEDSHFVSRFHEYLMPSVDFVVEELNSGRYDCLLFYKGRIGGRTVDEVFAPTGEAIAQVIERAKVPCYTWYVDRAYQFSFQPSRELWMRRVAPLCRVAFVADGALGSTPWARWHVLREPIDRRAVQRLYVPEAQRKPLAFIGQLYGSREDELAPLAAEFSIEFIAGCYGAALSQAVQGYKIIIGPRYPTVPGFWGNRVYVVLGHGGFFLAPEVDGMREEGILPGVHYALLGADPRADVRRWLDCPEERERIARTGQQLVLERFTYRRAVRELCRVIEETL